MLIRFSSCSRRSIFHQSESGFELSTFGENCTGIRDARAIKIWKLAKSSAMLQGTNFKFTRLFTHFRDRLEISLTECISTILKSLSLLKGFLCTAGKNKKKKYIVRYKSQFKLLQILALSKRTSDFTKIYSILVLKISFSQRNTNPTSRNTIVRSLRQNKNTRSKSRSIESNNFDISHR